MFRISDILVRIRIRDQRIRIWILLFSSRCQQKNIFFLDFCLLLLEETLTSFVKDKKSQNSRNQGFSYYFSLMMKGSGFESAPLTNASRSGSGRPKNLLIWNNDFHRAQRKFFSCLPIWFALPQGLRVPVYCNMRASIILLTLLRVLTHSSTLRSVAYGLRITNYRIENHELF